MSRKSNEARARRATTNEQRLAYLIAIDRVIDELFEFIPPETIIKRGQAYKYRVQAGVAQSAILGHLGLDMNVLTMPLVKGALQRRGAKYVSVDNNRFYKNVRFKES